MCSAYKLHNLKNAHEIYFMTLCYTTLHYAASLTFRNSLWNVHNPVCEILTCTHLY